MDTVGSCLRDARRRRGWSQLRLAAEAGVGHATVERCKRAEATPTVENVQALARALQVQTAWLLEGQEPMVLSGQMSISQQFRMHTGPGTAGRPGFVIVEPGPWEVGDDGEWQAVDVAEGR